MRLNWRDYAILYWPVVLTLAFNVVSVIYIAGHEQGKRSMLRAAATSAGESK